MNNIRTEIQEKVEDVLLLDSYMAQTYNDKNFNSYQTGPGAALIDKRGNQNPLLLCIKNTPQYIDKIGLYRILSNYGTIVSISEPKSESCSYYFAECRTENDFEAILKGMRNNEFNMKVEPKTAKKIQNNNENEEFTVEKTLSSQSERQMNEPEMSKRECKGPFNNFQHPKLSKGNKTTANQSKKYGFYYKNLHRQAEIYFNGKIDKDIRKDLLHKMIESSGIYDSQKGEFLKSSNISLPELKLSSCSYCKKIANKLCANCNQYYCSLECLHQYLKAYQSCCSRFPLIEKMISRLKVSNSNTIIKSINYEIPKSGEIVIITHVEQTNMAFIRSFEKNDDYIKTINEVEKYCNKAKFLQKLPNINEYVAAKYNDIWCRALVLNNQNSDQIHIAYIDFGNCEKRKLSEIKELLPECYNFKCYISVIYLKNLEKCVTNDKFLYYMNNIVKLNTQLKLMYNQNEFKNNKIVAELYILETNENINNKFIQLLAPTIPKDIDIPVMWEDLKKFDFPMGENISIIITSNSRLNVGIISCIPTCEVEELDDFNDDIKKYAESSDYFYTPRIEEMCIAKSEQNAWYRAYCAEVVGDGFPTLLFVDYGDMSPVSIRNIRKYPKSFTLPCKTNEFVISGLSHLREPNVEIGSRLRQLLPLYTEILVPKIECIDEYNLLQLPNIIDILKQEGLLKD